MKATVIFPINPSENQAAFVLETIDLSNKVCEFYLDIAWEMKSPCRESVHKAGYHDVKGEFGIKSQLNCSACDNAVEMAKSAKALIKKGKTVSKPKIKRKSYRLCKNTLSFNKTRTIASIATQQGRIKVSLHWHEQAMKYVGWACKAGEIGINKNGEWELRLVFEKTVEKPERTGNVVGVDMGIKRAVVTSDNRFLGQKKWKETERKLCFLIGKLQSKGTKSAKRRLKKEIGRLKRFNKDCDCVVAKQLMAGLKPGDTLALEDLTDIRDHCGRKGQVCKKQRIKVNRWRFKQLADRIIFVAEIKGVWVEFVDPRYTSQTCSKCGVICKSNRKSQSNYSCRCGLNLNADLNAARNLEYAWCMANGYTPRPSVNRPIVANASSKSV